MKTKFWFLLILLLFALTFVSCDASGVGETTLVAETTTGAQPTTDGHVHEKKIFNSAKEWQEFRNSHMDLAVSHKPTREDVMKITDGMPIAEVFEILGKPHIMGATSSMPTVLWHLDDGSACEVWFEVPEECLHEQFDQFWECGYVFDTPEIGYLP